MQVAIIGQRSFLQLLMAGVGIAMLGPGAQLVAHELNVLMGTAPALHQMRAR